MIECITNHYSAIKALHLVAVISWMAGLFYLPRLFVYHATYPENGEMLKIMEAKLYKQIMNPAMVVTIVTGFALFFSGDFSKEGWMYAKIACVFCLVVFHLLLNGWRKALAIEKCSRSSTFFRFVNEVPTLVLILIIILITFKPF